MERSTVKLNVENMEKRITPDATGCDPGTIQPTMAPQDPVVVPPDYQIILPGGGH